MEDRADDGRRRGGRILTEILQQGMQLGIMGLAIIDIYTDDEKGDVGATLRVSVEIALHGLDQRQRDVAVVPLHQRCMGLQFYFSCRAITISTGSDQGNAM